MERVEYRGWPNCYRLTNDKVELIVTTDVGPRIIRFGFVDGPNMFKEFDDMVGKTGGDEWRIYGGHRLWHAPEVDPRTYAPDNDPVQIEQHDGFVRLIQKTEPTSRLQKEIDIYLHDSEAKARLVHRIRNKSVWPIEFAPWALSVMAPGGVCVFPLPPRGTHPAMLEPQSTLTLWAFTNIADPRWTLGREYIMLRQDETGVEPQKMGARVPDGWAAYANYGQLFVKRFDFDPSAEYADMGCNFETFTNEAMLEVETLGPLLSLEPEKTVEHTENWLLVADVTAPQKEADIAGYILPHVR